MPRAVSSRRPPRASQDRERLAQEAARLIVEGGIRDYGLAKRKALERLRASPSDLPGNDEVERAVSSYQRLFRADSQPLLLGELRALAAKVMRRLEAFSPKLVGAVLSGTADEHSDITIHLFADTAEEVEFFLLDRRIPFELGERRLRLASDAASARLPTFRVLVEEVPVELVVFAGKARRAVPLSPVDGRPMQRAGLAAVQDLAEAS